MSFELIYAALTFGTVFLFGMFILWNIFGRGIRKEFPAPSVGEAIDGFYVLSKVNRERSKRGLPELSSKDARIAEAARPIYSNQSLTGFLIGYEIGMTFGHNNYNNSTMPQSISSGLSDVGTPLPDTSSCNTSSTSSVDSSPSTSCDTSSSSFDDSSSSGSW